MIIDTHCHLDKPRYKNIMNLILENAQKNSINGILIPATQQDTIENAKILADSYQGVFYAIGFHPKYAEKYEDALFEKHLKHERCIAIGECGLDRGRLSEELEICEAVMAQQRKVLIAHLEWAIKAQKPILIHLRDKWISSDKRATVYDEFLEIVQPYLGRLVGGVIHAMNFDRDDYVALAEHNFYFGIGGQLTFDNMKGLKNFIKKAPLESLVLETDAPWLTPKSRLKDNQKVSNEPSFIVDVLKSLSELLEMKRAELEEILFENSLRFFPEFKELLNYAEGYNLGKIRKIVQLGRPILRKIAKEVEDIKSQEIQNLINDLILTCIDSQGMGIASPQIGVSKRIFIMASHPNSRYPHAPKMKPKAIINPEILSYSDEVEKDWEGCLSLPNIRGLVPRATKIEVRYMTQKGEIVQEVLEGFLARIFQHEFDHLNSKVFIDRVESTLDIVMEREYMRILHEK